MNQKPEIHPYTMYNNISCMENCVYDWNEKSIVNCSLLLIWVCFSSQFLSDYAFVPIPLLLTLEMFPQNSAMLTHHRFSSLNIGLRYQNVNFATLNVEFWIRLRKTWTNIISTFMPFNIFPHASTVIMNIHRFNHAITPIRMVMLKYTNYDNTVINRKCIIITNEVCYFSPSEISRNSTSYQF